jgi:hypothetical protein
MRKARSLAMIANCSSATTRATIIKRNSHRFVADVTRMIRQICSSSVAKLNTPWYIPLSTWEYYCKGTLSNRSQLEYLL